jgi:hypothetical protein
MYHFYVLEAKLFPHHKTFNKKKTNMPEQKKEDNQENIDSEK